MLKAKRVRVSLGFEVTQLVEVAMVALVGVEAHMTMLSKVDATWALGKIVVQAMGRMMEKNLMCFVVHEHFYNTSPH